MVDICKKKGGRVCQEAKAQRQNGTARSARPTSAKRPRPSSKEGAYHQHPQCADDGLCMASTAWAEQLRA